MTATNHALTGATLALALHGYWLAVPLAFASHFALDAIPHYSPAADQLTILRSKGFKTTLIVDFLLCVTFIGVLSVLQPHYWWMAAIAALVATSPDLFWIKKFWKANTANKLLSTQNIFLRFHAWIQWYAHPIGALVEVAWFISMSTVLITFLR